MASTSSAQPAIRWSSRLVVTLKRGLAGKRSDQRATVVALGLRKRESTVEVPNNPSVRGMIEKVKRLVQVETKEISPLSQACSEIQVDKYSYSMSLWTA
ncbi:unnamed protein product [Closterium sp. Yama58-4]|nr:unnamed protein product [Closterium sp. Yama58-4]